MGNAFAHFRQTLSEANGLPSDSILFVPIRSDESLVGSLSELWLKINYRSLARSKAFVF